MTKKELRMHIKDLLRDNVANLKEQSEIICRKVIETEAYKASDVILAYMALFDEVNLSAVIRQAFADGKKIYVPRVVPGTSDMDFFRLEQESKTEIGSFGIDEPDPGSEIFELRGHDDNILVLVPGRAFTKDGKRLGRGKGYYDKYLGDLIRCNAGKVTAMGVCFELQLVDELPVEAHDIKMNLVVW